MPFISELELDFAGHRRHRGPLSPSHSPAIDVTPSRLGTHVSPPGRSRVYVVIVTVPGHRVSPHHPRRKAHPQGVAGLSSQDRNGNRVTDFFDLSADRQEKRPGTRPSNRRANTAAPETESPETESLETGSPATGSPESESPVAESPKKALEENATKKRTSKRPARPNSRRKDSTPPPEEPPTRSDTPSEEFLSLGIDPQIARAVAQEGYSKPTEIQARAIPEAINGKDLLGLAQTGTGKTAAFSIPILQRLHQKQRRGKRFIRALILTPTRELAIQIQDSLRTYGRHLSQRSTVILGGVSAVPQIAELKKTPDILVATPGRLLDLMQQGYIAIDRIETFVLDEADRMLDMGFIHDVKKVVAKLPDLRQTLFFSATMPKEVDQLAQQILQKPVRVEVAQRTTVPRKIDQSVFMVSRLDKRKLLAHLLKTKKGTKRVLIFARTKRRADTVVRHLKKLEINVAAIHSNKTQGARQNALGGFAKGKIRVLVATDIVARGIDVDDITHVINYDLPHEPESYVHRIGRTARAGALGVAWSFCDGEELKNLEQIEKIMQRKLEVNDDQPFHTTEFAPRAEREPRRANTNPRGKRGRRDSAGTDQSRGKKPKRPRRGGRSSRRDDSHQEAHREARRRDRRSSSGERSPIQSESSRSRSKPQRREPTPRDENRRSRRPARDEQSQTRTPRRQSAGSRTRPQHREPSRDFDLVDNFGDTSRVFGSGRRGPSSSADYGSPRRSEDSERRRSSQRPADRSGGRRRSGGDDGRASGNQRSGDRRRRSTGESGHTPIAQSRSSESRRGGSKKRNSRRRHP